MSSRSNQLLLGIIIMLIGLFLLFRPSFSFSISAVMFTISGLAFLLLYRTKRQSLSLVFGGYLTYVGLMGFMQPYMHLRETFNVVAAMFFIVPALIFLVLYYDKGKRGLLLPSMLMLGFGIFLFSKGLTIFSQQKGLLFMVCMGLALVLTFLLGRGYTKRLVLILGCVMIVCGFTFFGGLSAAQTLYSNLPQALALGLILVSIIIIIRALRRR